MTFPNFLVIGAYKAGTTSLYHYLAQHPQITMSPIKEVRFLTYAGHEVKPLTPIELRAVPWPVKTVKAYEALFRAASPSTVACGEISPCYLAFPEQSIIGIQRYVPQAKLIVILRNPADRAYSSHVGLVRIGREEEFEFAKAMQLERDGVVRRNDGSPRRNLAEGYYYSQLSCYYRAFPAEKIYVCLYDDYIHDASGFIKRVFQFLGADEQFTPDVSRRYNRAAWPRNQAIHRFLYRPGPFPTTLSSWIPSRFRRPILDRISYLNLTVAPRLDPDLRRQLIDLYRDDILNLQSLIGRDLSHWLKMPASV